MLSLVTTNLRSAIVYADTTQPVKSHKISHRQFLDRYGKDDTAKTLINYFFLQRKKTSKTTIVSSVALGVGVALTAYAAASVSIFGVAFVTVPVMILSLGFLLRSCSALSKFSRKKLLKTLDNYFAGKGVPVKLRKLIYHK
jgi:hypothetical protein